MPKTARALATVVAGLCPALLAPAAAPAFVASAASVAYSASGTTTSVTPTSDSACAGCW
jgi:hypothetical protein